MKSLIVAPLLFTLASTGLSHAAIVFSGGGTEPIVLTFTSAVVIPVTVSADSVSGVGFVLPNVYSTPITGAPRSNPNETYGGAGTIQVTINLASGAVVNGVSLAVFGGIDTPDGALGNQDFYGGFILSGAPNLRPGDSVTFSAGSLSFSPDYIRIPDQPIEFASAFDYWTVQGLSATVPVPEPSLPLLGLTATLGCLRRRR